VTATVLVIRRGGLGDTLLMLPVLAALRRAHPGAALHFAGVHEFAAVLQHFAAVDRALSSETLQLWALSQDTPAGAAARARLCSHAHVVADDAAVLAVADATRVQVFDPRPARDDLPLAVQIGAQLGLAVSLDDARLCAPVSAQPRGPVVLAPGAGSPQKCWARDRWLELARSLAADGTPVLVVVGPTELERDDPRHWPWPTGTGFVVEASCVRLAERLRDARAFVGNDSGPTHLAAALSVPTVALFGAGRPRVFAPPGPHVRVVGEPTGGPPSASVAVVRSALV